MSKRKFKRLVEKKVVMGWDDPRMPTLSGMRRRGYTPESIRSFVNKTGVAKRNGISEIALLDENLWAIAHLGALATLPSLFCNLKLLIL